MENGADRENPIARRMKNIDLEKVSEVFPSKGDIEPVVTEYLNIGELLMKQFKLFKNLISTPP